MEVIASSNSWAEFDAKLGELGTDGDHSKDKGNAFEVLTKLYPQTNPTHSLKIKHIWNHWDIPQEVMDELFLERPEISVDLVAQVKDGTYWAIQCKFRQDPTPNLQVDELGSFFTFTDRGVNARKISKRLICTSTNDLGRNFRREGAPVGPELSKLTFPKFIGSSLKTSLLMFSLLFGTD